MKKIKIFLVFLSLVASISGCGLSRETGYTKTIDDLRNLQATTNSSTRNSALEGKMDKMIAGLSDLTSAIRAEKTAPVSVAKKPESGIFSQGFKKQPVKITPPKKLAVKKANKPLIIFKDIKGIADLKNRVADLEDKVNFAHPEIRTKGVTFGPANTNLILCKSDVMELNKIIKKHQDGLVKKITITGYASKIKPKKPGLENKTISQKRAEAMACYFKEKGGIEIQPKFIYNGCETDRYDQNRKVVIVYKEKTP